jgi:hypothetical protein
VSHRKWFGVAVAVAAVGGIGAVAVLGSEDLKPGPPGKVVVKDTDQQVISHPGTQKSPGWIQTITTYYLTTKDPKDGSTTRFKVPSSVYDHCYRGSSYPRCTKR